MSCMSTAALVVLTMMTPQMAQPAMTPLPPTPAHAAKMKSASLAYLHNHPHTKHKATARSGRRLGLRALGLLL